MIERFLNSEGQVTAWPAKEQAKIAVLEYLIAKFELDHFYSETEVNTILKKWHSFEDWALLRRELFDGRYFDRELNGSSYRRVKLP